MVNGDKIYMLNEELTIEQKQNIIYIINNK